MNRYAEIRNNTGLAREYAKVVNYLENIRKEVSQTFQVGRLMHVGLDYSYFSFIDDELKQKGLKYLIYYDHETSKLELYLSGRNRRINDQVKALLGLEGGVDWIYMFVLSEDFDPDEAQLDDILEKARSYMDFMKSEIDDIL